MIKLRKQQFCLLSLRSSVRSIVESLWLCYSTPTPVSLGHLFALLALCLTMAAITAALLFHWLTGFLKYDVQTAKVAVGIYATSSFILSSLIHPFRCSLTLIFPTLGTSQGRKLLLSASVMIVILYVLPNMAANIATLTHVVKCASEKLSQSLLNSSGLINTIKDNMVKTASINVDINMVQKLHDFNHTTNINVSEVEERLDFMSKQVQEDFSEIKSQVQDLKVLASRIFAALFVLYLFIESVIYLRSYLTSVRFDNTYITGGLRTKAAVKGISVEAKDLKNGVNSTSLRMTKRELCRCIFPALVITSYLLMTIFLILLDYLLYCLVKAGGSWISNIPSTNISISVQFKVTNPPLTLYLQNCLLEWFNLERTYTALIQTPSSYSHLERNESDVTQLFYLTLFLKKLFVCNKHFFKRYIRRMKDSDWLPIFRRSASKRQDSLPSSPSSGGVGNGVHTSSPSSTNSSSSSTGKRRSIFRTPSLSFHSKRNSDPIQLNLDNRPETALRDGGNQKLRHSFGFGRHKKKIARSQTEDLEKVNRSMFINCISSGTNEGDDSGFHDDVSSKRSSKHKKQLLPKSFSAHQRFSKNSPSVTEQGNCQDGAEELPKTATPGSWPGELVESSLQSPIISEDRTTAITPSDFVHVTEDSVSEVDALPAPSPAAPPEILSQAVATSQVSFTPAQDTTDKPILPDTSYTANTLCESTTAHTEPVTLQTVQEINPITNLNPNPNPDQSETSEKKQAPELSEDSSSNPLGRERRSRNAVLIQKAGRLSFQSKLETRPSHLRKPHTGNFKKTILCVFHMEAVLLLLKEKVFGEMTSILDLLTENVIRL
ncbi:Serine-rich coiled-coil domain-containing protein 1 [Triplophysa tibetana]|uniref:Serine-rich coiled-coil domain-containing protein 1 n=1 Tax=Triplophysa tibetana TaxID=1572043 RepID=A0A5A9NVW6_9TELE|nr:Serine-rich coiled-coil domain-containing protein 1 [Triplophysa tibetana]